MKRNGKMYLSPEDMQLAQILLRQTNSIDHTAELMSDDDGENIYYERIDTMRKKIIHHVEQGNLII